MRYIICDPDIREALYPFSQLRSFADIRIGLWTIGERYLKYLQQDIYKDEIYHADEVFIYINSSAIPDKDLIADIISLQINEGILFQNELLAICVTGKEFKGFSALGYPLMKVKEIGHDINILRSPFDILRFNQLLLPADINELEHSGSTLPTNQANHIIGSGKVIMNEGVRISGAFLNTENGPVYLGKNVQIMEGVCIRGPIAIMDDSIVKMGATLYGTTLIGKQCVIGGEIKNSVFFDYSNKAHHGYIGDSVIGSWCNMGAGTSCSNVKNNAGDIYIWNPLLRKPVYAGSKCGVMMGDHTRTAINTSLNSGTVTGICCNIVKHGFPSKYIADFTWDVNSEEIYSENKLLKDVHNWMKMKNKNLDEKDMHLLLQHYRERKTQTQ